MNRNRKRNVKLDFESKKSQLGQRLKKEYIDNGIATVPCKVSGYEDIISPYSVKNYETMNMDFRDYVNDIVGCIPEKYPVVLEITGCSFSDEEKASIEDTIKEDYAYDLGVAEKNLKHHKNVFLFTLLGTILSGVLLITLDCLSEIPREFLFVLFWYTADTLIDYLFVGGYDLRKEHILAGRLACVQVTFSDEYDESDYTSGEARKIFEDIREGSRKS